MTPAGDPIPVTCEGSGCPPAGDGSAGAMCAMCGCYPGPLTGGVMPEHERDDIIARLRRGDYG